MKNVLTSIVLLAVFSVVIFFVGGVFKLYGTLEGPGEILGDKVPEYVIKEREQRISKIADDLGVESEKQILFGDLHVHTTYSTDAFMWPHECIGRICRMDMQVTKENLFL